MLSGYFWAVLVLGVPSLALGAVLGSLCGDDDAAWALGPVAGLALLVAGLLYGTAIGLDGWALTLVPLLLGAAGAAAAVVRRVPLRWLLAPAVAVLLVVTVFARPLPPGGRPGVLGYGF